MPLKASRSRRTLPEQGVGSPIVGVYHPVEASAEVLEVVRGEEDLA